MGRREGCLVPANGLPVLPCRAFLLANQRRPLLRAVPITCPHQDQQYSHRLITDSQTDRQTDRQTERETGVQTEDELKSKMRDILKWIQNNFFSAFVYILLFL